MVGSDSVDLFDKRRVRHGYVKDEISLRVASGHLQIYVINCSILVSAVTPMSNWNSEYEVLDQRKMIKTDNIIAPMGSIHHLSLAPPTEVKIPKPLMNRSLR